MLPKIEWSRHLTGSTDSCRWCQQPRKSSGPGGKCRVSGILRLVGCIWGDTGFPATSSIPLESAPRRQREISTLQWALGTVGFSGSSCRHIRTLTPRQCTIVIEARAQGRPYAARNTDAEAPDAWTGFACRPVRRVKAVRRQAVVQHGEYRALRQRAAGPPPGRTGGVSLQRRRPGYARCPLLLPGPAAATLPSDPISPYCRSWRP